jgi:hypothetical protein
MNAKAFREIPAPARKADYVGCFLFLREDSPADHREYIKKNFPERPYRKYYAAKGDVVQIIRRLNAKDSMHNHRDVSGWGSIRVLGVRFECATCGVTHQDYVPESWIEEGKAVFVEKYVKGEDTEEKGNG